MGRVVGGLTVGLVLLLLCCPESVGGATKKKGKGKGKGGSSGGNGAAGMAGASGGLSSSAGGGIIGVRFILVGGLQICTSMGALTCPDLHQKHGSLASPFSPLPSPFSGLSPSSLAFFLVAQLTVTS